MRVPQVRPNVPIPASYPSGLIAHRWKSCCGCPRSDCYVATCRQTSRSFEHASNAGLERSGVTDKHRSAAVARTVNAVRIIVDIVTSEQYARDFVHQLEQKKARLIA